LFREAEVGMLKAEVLKRRVLEKNPEMNITTATDDILYGDKSLSTDLIQDLDLLISTVDNSRVTHFSSQFQKIPLTNFRSS
jgi:molybdopterin/thiamine biosynthesis adenylyltransferase